MGTGLSGGVIDVLFMRVMAYRAGMPSVLAFQRETKNKREELMKSRR